MLDRNSVHSGDFLDKLNRIEDRSIDFIFLDPPYGMTDQSWDQVVSFSLLWDEVYRIKKDNSTIAIFASQPFTTKLISSNANDFRYCWYWIKNQGTNFYNAKKMPIRKVEEICIFGNGMYYPQITDGHPPTQSARGTSQGKVYAGVNRRNEKGGKTTRYPTNVLNFKCVNNYSRLHPNQKPVDLCEYMIKTYTREGHVVLDCFAGSGSIALACINTNRDYILIEKEKKYYNICLDRIANHAP